MSKHKITATRSSTVDGMDCDAEYEITFEFRKGAPEQGPSYASGGQPADPDEIDFVSISPGAPDCGAFTDIAQFDLEDWAANWLAGEGYNEAVAIAAEDHECAREEAREAAAADRCDAAREQWADR